MKKIPLIMLIVTFVVASSNANPKKKDETKESVTPTENTYGAGKMPFVDGKVIFSKVIPVENMSIDEMYSALKSLPVEIFVADANATTLYDDESKMILSTGYRLCGPMRFTSHNNEVWVTMKINIKEGRLKIDLYNIFIKKQLGTTTDYVGDNITPEITKAEALTDEVTLNKNGFPKKLVWGGYCREIVIYTANKIMDITEQHISKMQSGDPENNW